MHRIFLKGMGRNYVFSHGQMYIGVLGQIYMYIGFCSLVGNALVCNNNKARTEVAAECFRIQRCDRKFPAGSELQRHRK